MSESLRQFNCARCSKLCEVCGCCDRGNIYCGKLCSLIARAASMAAAGKRYQKSFKGAVKHALRQHHYRARRCLKNEQDSKKVTHLTSPLLVQHVVLQTPVNRLVESIHGYCDFCGRWVGEWLRRSFYKRRGGTGRSSMVGWPQGP